MIAGELGKVLVTGASGFVGRHLMARLVNCNCEVLVYSGGHKPPLNGVPTTTSFDDCKKFQPDTIIHLSANASVVRSESQKSLDDTVITQEALNCCGKETHFIFLSSVLVQPNSALETGRQESTSLPNSFYGVNKLFSEKLIKYKNEYEGLKHTIIRVPAIVGGGVTHGLMFDIIRKLRENDKLELLGDDPGSIKPFVHVGDLVEFIMGAVERGLYFDRIEAVKHFGPSDILSVRQVAEIAQEVLGTHKEIIFLGASSNWSNDAKIIKMPVATNNPPHTSEQAVRLAFQEIAQC